jgi:hypothetical protein
VAGPAPRSLVNEVHDLDGHLAFPRDHAADLRDRGPAHGRGRGIAIQGSFFSCLSRAGMLALTVIT